MNEAADPISLPPEFQARLARFLPGLPRGWRVSSARLAGRDWIINLADGSGAVVSEIVLPGERTAGEIPSPGRDQERGGTEIRRRGAAHRPSAAARRPKLASRTRSISDSAGLR